MSTGGVPFGMAGPPQPGFQPSPQQIQALQQHFIQEAARRGLTPQQFGEQLKQEQAAKLKAQQEQQQQQGQAAGQGEQQGEKAGGEGQQQGQGQPRPQGQPPMAVQRGQQIPIQPGPPKPEALAVAKFLKSQDLKSRPCIFQEKRKELFKVKRAIRALNSPAYEKARSKKGSLLPPITDRATAENVFKLLPISMLAIRVSRIDPNDNPAHGEPGHVHGGGGGGKQKGKKALWNVRIEQQQEANDDYYYIWFYEGSQWKQKLYAVGALLIVMLVVLFPLWPYTLRKGVWYLSMGSLGLLGAFFGLAIVRLIIFLITVFSVPPGIWIYPNLFEDVGFFDSFRPAWAWRETKESIAVKKAEKKEKKQQKKLKKAGAAAVPAKANGVASKPSGDAVPIESKAGATGSAAAESTGQLTERKGMQATVEEADDE